MSFVGRSKLQLLLVVSSAICFTQAHRLNAQASYGKFRLPAETQWGKAILPAGNYSYQLDHAGPGGAFTIHGPKTALMIPVSGAVAVGPPFDDSTLQLDTQAGRTTLRSIRIGRLGLVVQYRSPKQDRPASGESRKPDIVVSKSESAVDLSNVGRTGR